MAAENQRIYLIRHGETEFNRLGVFRGQYEVGLNDRGRQQAKEIGGALKGEGLRMLLTSPLGRAVETARIIGEVTGIAYKVDEAFNNIALGQWQGVEKDRIKRDFPEEWHLWSTEPERLVIPGGETVVEVRRRAFSRLLEVLGEEKSTLGIVTHRSVIKGLAAAMLGVAPPYFWKFYIDNAAYSVFRWDGRDFSLLSWNNNSHLSEKVVEVF